jgi:hypothetical protein
MLLAFQNAQLLRYVCVKNVRELASFGDCEPAGRRKGVDSIPGRPVNEGYFFAMVM